MKKRLIRSALVIDPSVGLANRLDILLENGRIAAIASDLPTGGADIFEASGYVCAPGLVDLHVHLRDPGQTHKENIESGCNAAAAGGVTSLACMPNTSPAIDSAAVVEDIVARAASARARVYPVAAVSHALDGQTMTDFASLKAAGARGVSDDGHPVASAAMMRGAMRLAAKLDMPVLSHCEELSLVHHGIMNEGAISHRLGVPGIDRAAEDVGTARDIALAAATGLPVHICHVSTKGSVALLRDARRRGVPVTGETAPHYFMFTEECLLTQDADYRMNPPLRTQEDVEAVIEGLLDGTLSAIATDHAPHSPQEKADFQSAPNGSIGMETSLAAGITALVKPGHLSLSRLISLMSTQPAQILGIPAGTLAIGAPADIVLFDPEECWTVSPDELHGKSRNTPFKGITLQGRVKTTIVGGRLVYHQGRLW